MGAYKFYNPSTEQWEIIKSKSIRKGDGSLEYTPDDIQEIDNKIGNLSTMPTTEKTNLAGAVGEVKNELSSHKAEIASQTTYGHIRLEDIPTPTKSSIGLGLVDNIKQLPIGGGNMEGVLTAQSNALYTARQVRNIILSPYDADVNLMQNGEIWIKYK